MKTCKGYWPDPGTPCWRILGSDGRCSRADDPDHGYQADRPLDPRWDWCNIQTVGEPEPVWIKGQCKHLDPDPVTVTDPVTGDVILVAWLCVDCDEQFEPSRFRSGRRDRLVRHDDAPDPWTLWPEIPPANGFERWAYPPVIFPELKPEDSQALVKEFFRRADDRMKVLAPPPGTTSLSDSLMDPRLAGPADPPVRWPLLSRLGRAYVHAFLALWNGMVKGTEALLESIVFMAPLTASLVAFLTLYETGILK